MLTPDKDVLSAIVNLERDNDFQTILGYLGETEIYLAKTACQMPDDLQSKRLQGGSRALTSFLAQVATAREKLQKAKK